jgi:hypothetical protein
LVNGKSEQFSFHFILVQESRTGRIDRVIDEVNDKTVRDRQDAFPALQAKAVPVRDCFRLRAGFDR